MEQQVTCPSCKNSFPADATFCPHCGKRLVPTDRESPIGLQGTVGQAGPGTRPLLRRRWFWIVVIAIAAVAIAVFNNQSSSSPSKATATPATPAPMATQPTTYEIVESKDISHKAITGPLSSYTVAQLQALPMDTKYSFKVVVPPTITQAQVKPTVDAMVKAVTTKNPDLDEATFLIYSSKEIVDGTYDVASAVWAPGGALGNVTPTIASTNDRSTYQTKIDIVPNLEASLKASHTPTTRFGLSDTTRREIYKAIVSAEDRGQAEADKQIPIEAGATLDTINQNTDLARKLTDQYKRELQKKYGITEDVVNQIGAEGLVKHWPMPPLP